VKIPRSTFRYFTLPTPAVGSRLISSRYSASRKITFTIPSYGLSLGEIREIFALSRQDPSGEKSRLRLLTRYREKWREAMKRRERIEAYIDDLEWHIDQLERVGNFQACPGEECRSCRYTGICKFYNENHRSEVPQ
jgi:hypothetical protein